MNLHLVVLAGYSAGLILFGVWIGRSVRESKDFFVAGRALSPTLIFATVMAANIGAGTTVGAASLGYRFGLSAWWWGGSAGIGTFFLAFLVGPRIYRLASERGFYTVGDFLEHRYGANVRAVMTAFLWVGAPAILASQLMVLSIVMEVVAGVPRLPGLLVGGVVTTTYFTAGGLRGAAWINLVQLVVLAIGFVLAVSLAVGVDVGSGSDAREVAHEAPSRPSASMRIADLIMRLPPFFRCHVQTRQRPHMLLPESSGAVKPATPNSFPLGCSGGTPRLQ